jgi:RNA polymerase-associated protein
MRLYAERDCPESHCVRLVLAEKGVKVVIHYVHPEHKPSELGELNPYNRVPTLVDRDLVLYESEVIVEYLDERYPHPPLMPLEPSARAGNRLCRHRIKQDLYQPMHLLATAGEKRAAAAKRRIREDLDALALVLSHKPFFMSNDYSLMDCYLAPLLWRLPQFGIDLEKQAKPLADYAQRIFQRPSFQASLTPGEQEPRA